MSPAVKNNVAVKSGRAPLPLRILFALFTCQVIILGVMLTNKSIGNLFMRSAMPVPLFTLTDRVKARSNVIHGSRLDYLLYKQETKQNKDTVKDQYLNSTINLISSNRNCSGSSSSSHSCTVSNNSIIGINWFPSLPDLFKVPRNNHKLVPRRISRKDYTTMMKLVQLVTRVLEQHNITYTLAYGSLLGSYYTHDMLPWDDDVDVFVHNNSKAQVMNLFRDNRHHGIGGHHHYKHNGRLFKLFFSNSKKAGGYPWKYPFIDIVTYVDYGEHHFKAVQRGANLTWPRTSFFPQHRRPFGPLWLWAPKDPWLFLKKKYQKFRCKSSTWSHKVEKTRKSASAYCEELAAAYPFVQRSYVSANITRETLMLNGTKLYSLLVNESYYKQASEYSFE